MTAIDKALAAILETVGAKGVRTLLKHPRQLQALVRRLKARRERRDGARRERRVASRGALGVFARVALVATALACAHAGDQEPVWVNTSPWSNTGPWVNTSPGANDEQLYRDKSDCLSRSMAGGPNQLAVFVLCMRGKGWVQQEVSKHR